MKIIYPIILLIAASFACNDNRSPARKAADKIFDKIPSTKNMNAGTTNYSLFVPEGWTTKRQSYRGIDYYFLLAPKTIDDPQTNINLITEDMRGVDLDKFVAASITSLKQIIPSAKILEKGKLTANGIKGRWYRYSMEPEGMKVVMIGYIFPKDGVCYIISCGTIPENFARHRSTFDKVAKSLKFNDE